MLFVQRFETVHNHRIQFFLLRFHIVVHRLACEGVRLRQRLLRILALLEVLLRQARLLLLHLQGKAGFDLFEVLGSRFGLLGVLLQLLLQFLLDFAAERIVRGPALTLLRFELLGKVVLLHLLHHLHVSVVQVCEGLQLVHPEHMLLVNMLALKSLLLEQCVVLQRKLGQHHVGVDLQVVHIRSLLVLFEHVQHGLLAEPVLLFHDFVFDVVLLLLVLELVQVCRQLLDPLSLLLLKCNPFFHLLLLTRCHEFACLQEQLLNHLFIFKIPLFFLLQALGGKALLHGVNLLRDLLRRLLDLQVKLLCNTVGVPAMVFCQHFELVRLLHEEVLFAAALFLVFQGGLTHASEGRASRRATAPRYCLRCCLLGEGSQLLAHAWFQPNGRAHVLLLCVLRLLRTQLGALVGGQRH
mmetsp:Transcript_27959/g.70157  ORF Transcript_27959/g.70157 Transcript_27959/m.70157 type:complete len:410 (+) Transcript_27959:811-2040(+)